MTVETETDLTPAGVLDAARRFYTDEDSPYAASPVSESATHITLATFRNRLVISARDAEQRTLVRVSTLRPDSSVGRFLSLLRSQPATTPDPA